MDKLQVILDDWKGLQTYKSSWTSYKSCYKLYFYPKLFWRKSYWELGRFPWLADFISFGNLKVLVFISENCCLTKESLYVTSQLNSGCPRSTLHSLHKHRVYYSFGSIQESAIFDHKPTLVTWFCLLINQATEWT